MIGIHVTYERDCRSMRYRLTDAKDIDLIIGYLGDILVFVSARDLDEPYFDFYNRAVDHMWEVRFDYQSEREAHGDTERDADGFERRPGLVPTLMLIDSKAEFRRYSALIPDHTVDDPEFVAENKGFTDFMCRKAGLEVEK